MTKREATTDDIARMVALLDRRGTFAEDSAAGERDRQRAIRAIMRYSEAKFRDVVPAMSAVYAAIHHLDPRDMHLYSLGGWQLSLVADAAWSTGYREGGADVKEDAMRLIRKPTRG